jgi:hypothetical protein
MRPQARQESAARAVLEAAKKAGAAGELLSQRDLQQLFQQALNPPKEQPAQKVSTHQLCPETGGGGWQGTSCVSNCMCVNSWIMWGFQQALNPLKAQPAPPGLAQPVYPPRLVLVVRQMRGTLSMSAYLWMYLPGSVSVMTWHCALG